MVPRLDEFRERKHSARSAAPHADSATAGEGGEVLARVRAGLDAAAATLVPWFRANMPEYYFRTHSLEEQVRHLQAIVATRAGDEPHTVVLRSPCGTRVTHIVPGGDMAALVAGLEQLRDEHIQTARLYSSADGTLRLDTFLLGRRPRCRTGGPEFGRALSALAETGFDMVARGEAFAGFLATATEDYVEKFEPGRAVRHFELCDCVRGTERVHVRLEPDRRLGMTRVAVAMSRPPARGLLLQAVKIFARAGVDVRRAYGDEFADPDGETLAVLSFYVDRAAGLTARSPLWRRVERQLRRIKWFAFQGLEPLAAERGWEIGRVQLLQAACAFTHQYLLRRRAAAYTAERIARVVLARPEAAEALLEFFEARFRPGMGRRRRVLRMRETSARAALRLREARDPVERAVLGCIYRFFRRVLRTNYYLEDRFGLAFRLDSRLLPGDDAERPYGVYCFHGPDCFGFHVRYRDMARGGLRLVPTRTREQYELESDRLFDEVTALARAQQLKNKDIPEGGAKAVLLLGPRAEVGLALHGVIDAFLDLLATGPDGRLPKAVVDYLGREEIIYLGPDEHITPEHIAWIAARARKRGYRWPSAFMSSKARAGVNHKRYGVTSEGVVVWAGEVLAALGLDPTRKPFSVKLTGGPAGDVASNAVRILIREYGERARILCLSDGHGCVYDPAGLDHAELGRLIRRGGRCHEFRPGKLRGEGAFVLPADTPEHIRLRDELHNRVTADLFIPAGGRPETINRSNWRRFLDAEGRPTARAMVEAANIFIAPEARRRLEERGLLVVPGSSANKTGVICSSYEVLAGLALSEDEFVAIKDDFVRELLVILRARARNEARLLLRERALSGGAQTLTELSLRLSRAINDLGDRILEVLEAETPDVAADPVLARALLAYCPTSLSRRWGERLLHRVPRPHQLALLAKHVSARIHYHEGLDWAERLLHSRPAGALVRAYLESSERVEALLRGLGRSRLAGREELERIVRTSGRRRLALDRLGFDEPRRS